MDYNAIKIEKLKGLMDTMREIMVEGDGDKPMAKDEVKEVLEETPEVEEESEEADEELPKHKEHGESGIPIMSLLKKAKAAPKAVMVEKITVAKKPEGEMPFKKKKA